MNTFRSYRTAEFSDTDEQTKPTFYICTEMMENRFPPIKHHNQNYSKNSANDMSMSWTRQQNKIGLFHRGVSSLNVSLEKCGNREVLVIYDFLAASSLITHIFFAELDR